MIEQTSSLKGFYRTVKNLELASSLLYHVSKVHGNSVPDSWWNADQWRLD